MEKDISFSDNQKKTDVAMLISNYSSEQETLPGIEILPNNKSYQLTFIIGHYSSKYVFTLYYMIIALL